MIRTTIEVGGKDAYEFEKNLKAALDKLGYEPKPSEDDARWRRDVFSALREAGVDIVSLVQSYRDKIERTA